jgi:ribonuclease BN (tRNA processing enzyme)
MRITPLGVGDAFDPQQPNSSSLVEQDGFSLLIDCGHSVVPLLWRARPDPETLDAVFLTHHHADHVIGLPSVLDRWSYEGRRKALLVVTSEWGEAQLQQICRLLDIKPAFPVHYVRPADQSRLGPFALRTAPTQHAIPNQALRLEACGRRFAYSGDGRPTPQSLALYAGADLLLHECWEPDPAPDISFHSDLPTVRTIEGPARIGLYHIRAGRRPAMRAAVAGDNRLFVAEPGQVLDL